MDFDPKFNLLHGRNNSGKTTIFYAVEYCLFGSVHGFKKIAQLARFKQNVLGVELILRGKNGTKYKLQRMHRLKGKKRSANGFFTLKKIIEDDNEKYVLASDFGDHEEDLSLKLLEILGISKRFFETGLHFAQGEISEIIRGDKELDIVFGIKTATALGKIFRRRALDFEKEGKVIKTLEAIIQEATKEKQQYRTKLQKKEEKYNNLKLEIKNEKNTFNQLKAFKDSSEMISNKMQAVEKAKNQIKECSIKLEMIQKEMEEDKRKYGSIKDLDEILKEIIEITDNIKEKVKESEQEIKALQKGIKHKENKKVELKTIKRQKESLVEEFDSFIKEHGSKQSLEKKLKEIEEKRKDISETIKQIKEEQLGLQTSFRTIEREKGDIIGILTRRKTNKDNQKCEYCGAPIDSEKIKTEIKECDLKLEKLDQKLKLNEEERTKLKEHLLNLQKKEKQLYQENVKITHSIKKIEDLENKIKSSFDKNLESKIDELKKAIDVEELNLKKKNGELKALREKQGVKEQKKSEINTTLKRNQELRKKLAKNQREKKNTEQTLTEKKGQLSSILETVKGEIEKYVEKVDEKDPILKDLETIFERIQEYETSQSIGVAAKLRDDFREIIISKISEKASTIKHLEEQKTQLIKDLEDNKAQIKRLDKKIAINEAKVQNLYIKRNLAEKYRRYQEIFNKTQEIIRDNVSASLEEKIFEFHNKLSTEEEFERVYVDSEDYSLYITPKGMEIDKDIYPAWVYEGGGYKLILGLAYKLSLSELIGKSSFLLIDEPTEFIDVNNRQNLLSNLSYIAKDTQVLLITHQDVDKIICDNKIKLK